MPPAVGLPLPEQDDRRKQNIYNEMRHAVVKRRLLARLVLCIVSSDQHGSRVTTPPPARDGFPQPYGRIPLSADGAAVEVPDLPTQAAPDAGRGRLDPGSS